MALKFRTLDFRTVDGSNNNLADPTLNQANVADAPEALHRIERDMLALLRRVKPDAVIGEAAH